MEDDRSTLTEESDPEPPFDSAQERFALGMAKKASGDASAVTEPTVDTSLAGLTLSTTTTAQEAYPALSMQEHLNNYHRQRAASHRVDPEEFGKMFDPNPTDQDLLDSHARILHKTYSTVDATLHHTTAMREESAERHEETQIAIDEAKDAVNAAKEELLEAGHTHQAEIIEELSDLKTTLLGAIQEATAKNEPEAVTRLNKELEQARAKLRKALEEARKVKIQQKKTDDENHKLRADNKAKDQEIGFLRSIAFSAKKPPRPSLAPVPSNRQPVTKRMAVAEMKHVGLKTDIALAGAEGVKRGNSSTLLP